MKRALPHRIIGAAVVLALWPFGSGGRAAAQPSDLRTIAAVRQAGAVIGTVWNRDDTPVANALLRLRNVTTGQVVLAAQADALGRFTFASVAPGSYIVELVDAGGHVLALGQMFAMGPGETVATFIRLGTRVPWFRGFFGNAAAAALASAASLGVTAIGDGVQPASGRS